MLLPTKKKFAASGGVREGMDPVKTQADQGNPSRRWEDLWWCLMTKCGQSNLALMRDCGLARHNALYSMVRGLKRKLEDAEQLIEELRRPGTSGGSWESHSKRQLGMAETF